MKIPLLFSLIKVIIGAFFQKYKITLERLHVMQSIFQESY